MTKRPHVLHLIDDTTAGGVMRVLDHIRHCPLMARNAVHSVQPVLRGKPLPPVAADVVVSHLTVSWRMLPMLILFRARNATTPLVHVEHSYTEGFAALNVSAKRRFHTLLRTTYALFDRVVAVSRGQARWMQARKLVSDKALQVINPVVDLQGFRALPPASATRRTVGAIGRLDPQKGFDMLIPAFRALARRDIRLNVYGDGSERAALEALAEGDDRIRFMGHAASPEAAMAEVDVVAMPSRWEAFGLVALEARAAGRPLVSSGVDGLSDQTAGRTETVAGWSVDSWSRALGRALNVPGGVTDDPTDRAETDFANAWDRLIAGVLGRDRQEAALLAS
ncbi:glycosyltransferase [Antarctobacter sp.]|uniref:glycosyltransferase n=1 Tax=Antarctobacter sp. TaxID=1872577 RepID=UPI002B2724B5|nr:glycosyltransferase [Antarctobacter sp.]